MLLSRSLASPRRALVAGAVAVAVALGVAAVVSFSTARPAGAAANESYPLPVTSSWAVIGRGYGHGRGMSQWGAQGAALQGLSGLQILGFYYPGTSQTTISNTPIRVLISRDEGTDLALGALTGLGVRDEASNLVYKLPAGPQRWRAVIDAGGMHIQSWDGTQWSAWVAPDGLTTWAGPLRFGVDTTTVLTLYVGSTAIQYRGKLTAVRTDVTTMATVNTLPMETYLNSVVPAESPAYWRAAALRAQAVAARTYAAYLRARHTSAQWDTCDSTSCQVYKGVSSEAASTTTAVQATANQIRSLNGQPILAEFSASNGGWTVASGLSYQVAKPDPYDSAGGTNPVFTWTTELSAASLQSRYPQIGQPQRLRAVTRDGNGIWGGRITDLFVDGSTGSVELTGLAARLSMRSNWWIPRATVSGPPLVAPGSTVLLQGTARPGAAVEVWFHRQDVAGYTLRRNLVADAEGRWTTTYLATVDQRYYAVSYGTQSPIGLTQLIS